MLFRMLLCICFEKQIFTLFLRRTFATSSYMGDYFETVDGREKERNLYTNWIARLNAVYVYSNYCSKFMRSNAPCVGLCNEIYMQNGVWYAELRLLASVWSPSSHSLVRWLRYSMTIFYHIYCSVSPSLIPVFISLCRTFDLPSSSTFNETINADAILINGFSFVFELHMRLHLRLDFKCV